MVESVRVSDFKMAPTGGPAQGALTEGGARFAALLSAVAARTEGADPDAPAAEETPEDTTAEANLRAALSEILSEAETPAGEGAEPSTGTETATEQRDAVLERIGTALEAYDAEAGTQHAATFAAAREDLDPAAFLAEDGSVDVAAVMAALPELAGLPQAVAASVAPESPAGEGMETLDADGALAAGEAGAPPVVDESAETSSAAESPAPLSSAASGSTAPARTSEAPTAAVTTEAGALPAQAETTAPAPAEMTAEAQTFAGISAPATATAAQAQRSTAASDPEAQPATASARAVPDLPTLEALLRPVTGPASGAGRQGGYAAMLRDGATVEGTSEEAAAADTELALDAIAKGEATLAVTAATPAGAATLETAKDSDSPDTPLLMQPVQGADSFGALLNRLAPMGTEMLAADRVQTPAPMQSYTQVTSTVAQALRGQVLQDGSTRIEVRTQDLGRIQVELSPTKDGDLNITLRSDNPQVLSALRADRELLTNLLRDSGVQMGGGSLNLEDYGQGESRGQGFAPDGTGQPLTGRMTETEETVEDSAPTAYTPTLGPGRVDILT